MLSTNFFPFNKEWAARPLPPSFEKRILPPFISFRRDLEDPQYALLNHRSPFLSVSLKNSCTVTIFSVHEPFSPDPFGGGTVILLLVSEGRCFPEIGRKNSFFSFHDVFFSEPKLKALLSRAGHPELSPAVHLQLSFSI